ncbi:MAG: hypothetical protein AB7U20_04245 [Planctomycetaceae bacterium]
MTPAPPQEFSGFGLRFCYPADWELSEELDDDQVSITVKGPETAFWSATVIRHRPDPRSVLRAALRAYEEEYDDAEITETEVEFADCRMPAARVDFICLELTNTAWLRAWRTSQYTLLLLYQLNDTELDDQEPVLARINASLIVETDLPTEPETHG